MLPAFKCNLYAELYIYIYSGKRKSLVKVIYVVPSRQAPYAAIKRILHCCKSWKSKTLFVPVEMIAALSSNYLPFTIRFRRKNKKSPAGRTLIYFLTKNL